MPAVILLVSTAGAGEVRTELTEPVRVSLSVKDRSTPLRGEVTAWAFGAFWVVRDGGQTPVRIGWDEIGARDVYNTARRIIDRNNATDYFRLGIEMLVLEDRAIAQRAFDYAVRKEESLLADTERAVALWEAGDDPRGAYDAMLSRTGPDPIKEGAPGERDTEENRFQAPTPEDDAQAKKGFEPWKPLGAEERERAIEVQRQYAATAGYARGDNLRRIAETEHFIMATDLSEHEMRRWSDQLEVMYSMMLGMFHLPESTALYAGKCNVFVFGDRQAYLNFEKHAMGLNAAGTGGICHYRGEDVVIAFYRYGGDAEFQSVLIHESVHGFMYRYRTPGRLPTWASEGLAEYIAGYLTPASNEPREQWTRAKNFVNQRKNPCGVMENFFASENRTVYESYALSHMLVRFLLRYKPAEFKLWLDDIKAGVAWERSMLARFGIDSTRLSEGFAGEIKSESKYTRLP